MPVGGRYFASNVTLRDLGPETRRSETRVQLGLDPGHPAPQKILQQCDLGGVRSV
jgi:hypothetical protein